MLKTLRDERGFSLLELMIVVAIISILASMAIPIFTQFQARAKQSEARVNLMAIYTAETTYLADNDHYAAAFADMSFTLAGGAAKFYDFTIAPPPFHSGDWIGAHGMPGDGPPAGTINLIDDTYKPGVTRDSFTALAVGNIENVSGLDTWTIASGKLLQNDWDAVIH